MRRGLVIFLLINFLIIAFLVRSVFTLLSLLIEDASADAIHRSLTDELPATARPGDRAGEMSGRQRCTVTPTRVSVTRSR